MLPLKHRDELRGPYPAADEPSDHVMLAAVYETGQGPWESLPPQPPVVEALAGANASRIPLSIPQNDARVVSARAEVDLVEDLASGSL